MPSLEFRRQFGPMCFFSQMRDEGRLAVVTPDRRSWRRGSRVEVKGHGGRSRVFRRQIQSNVMFVAANNSSEIQLEGPHINGVGNGTDFGRDIFGIGSNQGENKSTIHHRQ